MSVLLLSLCRMASKYLKQRLSDTILLRSWMRLARPSRRTTNHMWNADTIQCHSFSRPPSTHWSNQGHSWCFLRRFQGCSPSTRKTSRRCLQRRDNRSLASMNLRKWWATCLHHLQRNWINWGLTSSPACLGPIISARNSRYWAETSNHRSLEYCFYQTLMSLKD